MAKRKQLKGRPVNTEKQEAFAQWFSLHKNRRVPRTLNEWLEENKVAHSTTWRWRQDPAFRQKILGYRMETAEESMTDIIEGLKDRAVEGELGQAKFLFELLGDYLPKQEINHNVQADVGANGFSEEMLEFVAEEMLDHPKMVEMPKGDLVDILTTILIEE